jgi:hypothetical protein
LLDCITISLNNIRLNYNSRRLVIRSKKKKVMELCHVPNFDVVCCDGYKSKEGARKT